MCRKIVFAVIVTLVCTQANGFDLRQFGREIDNFRRDAWGVITDPVKLGEGSKNALEGIRSLERIVGQLDELREKFGADVDGHLTKVQRILAKANVDFEARIAQANQALRELEKQVYRDAMAVLRETECTFERMSNDTMLRGLASAINLIRKANPRVLVDLGLGEIEGEISVQQVAAIDPDRVYLKVRRERLAMLINVKGGDLAYSEIVSTYQNLGRLALATTCHYDRIGGSAIFLEDVNHFRALSVPWFETVDVNLQ